MILGLGILGLRQTRVIDDFIHHEGGSGPCALATKYTPCNTTTKNLIHTQNFKKGCFPEMYLERLTDFRTHFTTRDSTEVITIG